MRGSLAQGWYCRPEDIGERGGGEGREVLAAWDWIGTSWTCGIPPTKT